MLMLQFAKLALQQGVLGQMPQSYAAAPQAFIVPQYPGNITISYSSDTVSLMPFC